MIIKTGQQCKWEDIEINEVFAFNGCWRIYAKFNCKEALLLCKDEERFQMQLEGYKSSVLFSLLFDGILYKLSLKNQQLWRQDF